MFNFYGSKSSLWLRFLAVLLILQPLSSARDDDTEDVLSEPLLDDERTGANSLKDQPVADRTVYGTEEPQTSDNTVKVASYENEENDVVQTTGGPVIGSKLMSPDGVEVRVYYGIPYADAPIGQLRFRPPVRVTPWKTPKKAVAPIPLCYQELKDFEGSILGRPWTEDCLTLNVWAPKPKGQDVPVLVNIHGGAFIMGSSAILLDGSVMASSGIVVVSPSYRLSVFGFFSLGNSEAPGNVGLMDQTLALQWVKENAAAFGGDPNRVTLMGASAGAASVGYHLLSPMSKGLFKSAIVMGGAPINHWAIKEAEMAIQKSNALLTSLGCANLNISLSVDCIRQKDAEEILKMAASRDLLTRESFVPTVDGQFMTEHPDVCLEAGRIASPVPVIIGAVENEGSSFLAMKLKDPDGRVFRRQFQELIRGLDRGLTPLQVKALDVLYTNWSNPDDPYLLRDAARDLYGDYHIVCGVNKLTERLAETGSNVYRYVFGHSFGVGSWMGTTHGSDFLPILMSEMIYDRSAENLIVTKEFRRRIINFVKTRNPNQKPDGSSEEVTWPQYDDKNGKYLHVAVNISVKAKPRARECRLLEELLPAMASVSKSC